MADYNFLMESRLSPEQFRFVNHLSRIAAHQGLNLYLVGGAVRDLTLGQHRIRDLDLVVEGSLSRIIRQLKSSTPPKPRPGHPQTAEEAPPLDHLEVDERRGVAELSLAGGVRAEIAAARREVYGKPGEPPEIYPADIFEDLRRRDFSVNAMAVSLHPNSRGLLLDPTNGIADLERRELRGLHSRTFFEDPSRIYRLLRLKHRLQFQIEERTQRWLDLALQERAWESVEPGEQARELAAILREDDCGRVLRMLKERGLLAGLDRKLAASKIAYDRFDKIRSAARQLPGVDVFLLNLHALLEKLPPAHRNFLAKRVLGSGKTLKFFLHLEAEADRLARALSSPKAAQPSYVYTLLANVPPPLLLFLLIHYPAAKVQTRLKNFLFKFPALRARLPRAELLSLGMEPGPKLESVLERIFLDQLDGKIRTAAQLQKALRDYSGIKPPEPLPAAPSRHEAPKAGSAPEARREMKAGKAASRKPAGKPPAPAKAKTQRATPPKPRPKPASRSPQAKKK
jgi:tRNA nucleotidyltransferase (CCA-adding enzyme)